METMPVQIVCPHCQQLQSEQSICEQCNEPLFLLADRFRLRSVLGAGGFGVVFLADDLEAKQKVVIKLLRSDMCTDERANIRFQREIRVTGQLCQKNPHTIRLFAQGEEPGLGLFYVMEYLEGRTLGDMLSQNEAFSFEEVFVIFRQLCSVLSTAHELGIIHRDLKPENIYLIHTAEQPLFVKLLDFGLAKSLSGTLHEKLTTGVLGTPAYMAPEQCTNQEIDARTDIYALGLLLYEMLTRSQAFQGNTMTMLVFSQMSEKPDSLALRRPDLSFPEGLEQSLFKALAKVPDERFQTIDDFAQAMKPFFDVDGCISEAPTDSPAKQLKDAEKAAVTIAVDEEIIPLPPVASETNRTSRMVVIGVLLVVLLLGGAVWFWLDL